MSVRDAMSYGESTAGGKLPAASSPSTRTCCRLRTSASSFKPWVRYQTTANEARGNLTGDDRKELSPSLDNVPTELLRIRPLTAGLMSATISHRSSKILRGPIPMLAGDSEHEISEARLQRRFHTISHLFACGCRAAVPP